VHPLMNRSSAETAQNKHFQIGTDFLHTKSGSEEEFRRSRQLPKWKFQTNQNNHKFVQTTGKLFCQLTVRTEKEVNDCKIEIILKNSKKLQICGFSFLL
jgi:hypothetical protein